MNYHNITHEDMNNGDGIRVVLWVSGCKHHCPECQNPETWEFNSGIPFLMSDLNEIIEELKKDYTSGLTLSGGDPLAVENRSVVSYIIRTVKNMFPDKTVWVYTGYTFDYLLSKVDKDPYLKDILNYTDVLIDGEYKKDLRDISLKWRGSSNQKVIDVQKSLKENKEVLYCD